MNNYQETAIWLKNKFSEKPLIAVILGTGLSDLPEAFPVLCSLPYNQIPGFVKTTSPSHPGNLLLCEVKGIPIIFLQGRFHYY